MSPGQTAVKVSVSCKNGNGQQAKEYAAREMYFKSPSEDMGSAGSCAMCTLNHTHSLLLALPLPPLNFPLTILFKIHGLSYLFFGNYNYNSLQSAKSAYKI